MALGALRDGERGEEEAVTGDGLSWVLNAGDTGTVVRARALVEGTLTMLGAPREAIEDAETMTAELVGNAVRHAAPPMALQVSVRGMSVRVAVTDADERLPAFPPADHDAPLLTDDGDLDRLVGGLTESGRGLAVVQQLSEGHCGADAIQPGSDVSGKVVWFRQSLPTADSAVPERFSGPGRGQWGHRSSSR